MRTAVCLFGVVSGEKKVDCVGNYVDYEMCYESYKEHILVPNDADVFMHSWSVHLRDQVVELYAPKKHIFQKQIQFDREMDAQRNMSKTYSMFKAIDLKAQYEEEHGFKYDCVMLMRFDMIFLITLHFDDYKLKYLHFGYYNDPIRLHSETGKELPPNRINHSDRSNQLQDLFIFSSSENMDRFALLYKGLKEGVYRKKMHHHCIWDHVEKEFGPVRENVRYTLYRTFDYELYRYLIAHELDRRVS